jgi:hypothetical protein
MLTMERRPGHPTRHGRPIRGHRFGGPDSIRAAVASKAFGERLAELTIKDRGQAMDIFLSELGEASNGRADIPKMLHEADRAGMEKMKALLQMQCALLSNELRVDKVNQATRGKIAEQLSLVGSLIAGEELRLSKLKQT